MASNSGASPAFAQDTRLSTPERQMLDELFRLNYEELRGLAASVRRLDANATLSPATLVHEAWLKLANSGIPAPLAQLHFKRLAAKVMRQIVTDAARRRIADKRGGASVFITLDDSLNVPVPCDRQILALEKALADLNEVNPRQVSLVEMRCFGGLDVAQAAEVLGLSKTQVGRDWRAVKAWLTVQLRAEA
jgi:RNA polymerase sigma factor (TIGR02999 family)